eukprot:TRINITY_DN47205_c0_g1_i1.p1 TRINITY_DN47205_c0_g1~~TRINITY_DN47205_c0_g1_i1.p1  ORF type:complete len:428 (-),score=56.11 TRINITY_DN47205_c0_g1_i1:528-1637(-)
MTDKDAAAGSPDSVPQTEVDIQRQAIFRQVLELAVAAHTPTLLVHFYPAYTRVFEFCTQPEIVQDMAQRYAFLKQAERVTTITHQELLTAPVPAEEQQRKIEQLEEVHRQLLVDLERAKGASSFGPHGDILSSLADPREIRLPGWGGSVACLMVYKHILLTGMWRGQPVRIVETMHLDLDLRDGEVYMCSQPWLFSSANGKGSQKPRHDHHTFKFQRQLPASKWLVADGVTFRKARCARKKCLCVESECFELIGAKLTYSPRELTLYHFRKTPINVANIHPRHYVSRDLDNLASGLASGRGGSGGAGGHSGDQGAESHGAVGMDPSVHVGMQGGMEGHMQQQQQQQHAPQMGAEHDGGHPQQHMQEHVA